jgi:uncharacterized protein (AIM24 family)
LKYRLIGDSIQSVAVELSEGEGILMRTGSMLFARGSIKSESNLSGPYWNVLLKALVKEGEPGMALYLCTTGNGLVGIKSPSPGKIQVMHFDGTTRSIVVRNRILVMSQGIMCDPFESNGLKQGTLVTISGTGWLFLHGPGGLVEFALHENEDMVIDTGMIVALDGPVDFACVQNVSVDPSCEAPPLMRINGPGKIVLHTQDIAER